MNLRNAPVDKRRLRIEDRQFDTSRRENALKSAKQRRGSLAYSQNRQMRTTQQAPGSGGFTQKGIQAGRLRDEGIKTARTKNYRPEDPV